MKKIFTAISFTALTLMAISAHADHANNLILKTDPGITLLVADYSYLDSTDLAGDGKPMPQSFTGAPVDPANAEAWLGKFYPALYNGTLSNIYMTITPHTRDSILPTPASCRHMSIKSTGVTTLYIHKDSCSAS